MGGLILYSGFGKRGPPEDVREWMLKNKKREKELESVFESSSTGLGNKNFDVKKKKKRSNLYQVLPHLDLDFKLGKKESILFLKENGLKKLQEEVTHDFPDYKLKFTDLKISPFKAELTYLGEKCKDYIKAIAKEENTEKIRECYDLFVKEFKEKTFRCFGKNKDTKASVSLFGFDKSQEQKEAIKTFLETNKGTTVDSFNLKVDTLVGSITRSADENEKNVKVNSSNIEEVVKKIDILMKFEKYSSHFMRELHEAKRDSVFEYVVTSLPVAFKDSIDYEKKKDKCQYCQCKILFHGSSTEPVSNIILNKFELGSGKLGIGVYFSDMLDFVSCYSRKKRKSLKVGESFYVVASEVFFDRTKAERVTDKSYEFFWTKEENNPKNFPDEEDLKLHPKSHAKRGGINYAVSKNFSNIINDLEISESKNYFLGREYVISYLEQINSMFGVTLKRVEYCIIWRDPNFDLNNESRGYIENLKETIEKDIGYNLYIETSEEEALNLVKKKKYNKVILISNIGKNLEGKRFVEEARKILGCKAFVLFSSYNKEHLKEDWLKNFDNALFSNDSELTQKVFNSLTVEGLKELKAEFEDFYECKFKDFEDILKYKYFLEEKEMVEFKSDGFEFYKHKFLPYK